MALVPLTALDAPTQTAGHPTPPPPPVFDYRGARPQAGEA
jgi:hypothetical protein